MSSSDSSFSSDERSRKRGGKFICNNCGRKFQCKTGLQRHVLKRVCKRIMTEEEKAKTLTCNWCKLTFTNRGNLVTHTSYLHGDLSYKASQTKQNTFNCGVCKRSFRQNFQLTYHIRRIHFNLKAKIPYAELKKVNQVWFERVLNSDNLIEIKKTGINTLLMRKLENNSALKVSSNDNEIDLTDVDNEIDLTDVYPTQKKQEKIQCGMCKKMYVKRDYKKHVEEIHYNRKKQHCNNCNRSFKRVYHYIQHVCSKMRNVRGVKQFDNDLRIASIESLSIPFA